MGDFRTLVSTLAPGLASNVGAPKLALAISKDKGMFSGSMKFPRGHWDRYYVNDET